MNHPVVEYLAARTFRLCAPDWRARVFGPDSEIKRRLARTANEEAMMMPRAFIHGFETETAHYVYDVNSNRVARVEEVVSDILQLCDSVSPPDFVSLLSKKHGRPTIETGLKEVMSSATCFHIGCHED